MARKLAAVAFSLGCLHAGSLMALGLGEIKLESFLNEPLKASVDLLNMGGLHEEEIKIRLATSEDFDKLGLERAYFLTNIRFEVAADENGRARILITSEEPVLEPYLDFIVEARWPSGRLIREYTVLVDPPVFSQGAKATPAVSASQRVEEVEGIAAEESTAAAKKNEVADSNTGDWGLNVRESNLPSGAMPQRNYSAATAPTPMPGTRYMISRDQTLWQIANQAKPAGVSVHQTMLDIQRLNPDAFINGNINRIKAGYIIYLPAAEDISSADLPTALAEVRQQNEAWREGRDAAMPSGGGPSLRISAEPEETVKAGAGQQGVAGGGQAPTTAPPQPASTPAAPGAPVESADTLERLAALEQQLQTLQRIVSLKDDQITALQNSLAAAGGAPVAAPEGAAPVDTQAAEAGTPPAEPAPVPSATETPDAQTPPVTEPTVAETKVAETKVAEEAKPKVAEVPAKVAKTKPDAAAEPASGDSWTSYILYILGALVLAIAGIVFARRRRGEEEELVPVRKAASREDVFSDVRLQDQNLEVEASADEADVFEPAPAKRDNRGYGERKHDEYASDVDAADALAEADIYIAYGRHPQAIDLLNNALANEPGNPVYRLKLLEIYTELNNRVAATAQLKKIQATGDPDSIARAESLIEGLRAEDEVAPPKPAATTRKPVGNGPGLSPNPLAMMSDANEGLEADFSGLEIEMPKSAADDEDDLDLSSDFTAGHTGGFEDEELVIAAESNGLSTKLDLARAYLDMGDDDGARQILDEVVAEGNEELKAEARTLLNRIGG
jgi:pilus assembly protein FimV